MRAATAARCALLLLLAVAVTAGQNRARRGMRKETEQASAWPVPAGGRWLTAAAALHCAALHCPLSFSVRALSRRCRCRCRLSYLTARADHR